MKNLHKASLTAIASIAMMIIHFITDSPFAFVSLICFWIATIVWTIMGYKEED